jgi:ribosomal protein L23
MSDDASNNNKITEEQVRQRFEELYGVTIEEVKRALTQSLEEDHRLLKKMEENGFTEGEERSMQEIQDYVEERDES